MTPEFLRRCVDAYDPDSGISRVAHELGIGRRTLQRWLDGAPIPSWINRRPELPEVLRTRAAEHSALAAECIALARELEKEARRERRANRELVP